MDNIDSSMPQGTHVHSQRIRIALREFQTPHHDALDAAEIHSTKQRRRPDDLPPRAFWQHVLYGAGTAGVTLFPLIIPGVGYMELMLGLTVLAVAFFLVVLLAGLFKVYLPLGRHSQKSLRRKR